MSRPVRTLALSLLCAGLAAPALAQEPQGKHLAIELNAAQSVEAGCTLSFLAQNGYDTDIAGAVFETVLFDSAGQVAKLTLFDFGALPAGRPRVRQFVVPGLACDGLSRILINGASRCDAGELGASACTDGLELDSRTDMELLG